MDVWGRRLADDDRLRSLAEERQRERAGSRLHAALMLALVQSGGEGEGAGLIGRPPRPVSPGAIFRGWEQDRDRASELRHSWETNPLLAGKRPRIQGHREHHCSAHPWRLSAPTQSVYAGPHWTQWHVTKFRERNHHTSRNS